MGLKKGMTNNPKGRPKGSSNKVTKELRQWIGDLLDDNRSQIIRDLKAVEPEKRLIFLEKLMAYVIPKKQDSTLSMINKLSDEDLDKVVSDIMDKMDQE